MDLQNSRGLLIRVHVRSRRGCLGSRPLGNLYRLAIRQLAQVAQDDLLVAGDLCP